jgi:hypothetical protein
MNRSAAEIARGKARARKGVIDTARRSFGNGEPPDAVHYAYGPEFNALHLFAWWSAALLVVRFIPTGDGRFVDSKAARPAWPKTCPRCGEKVS